MITAYEECEVGCFTGSTIVFVEIAYGSKLLGDGHGVEVVGVADCLSLSEMSWVSIKGKPDLEIAANDK